jgi:hypothetical protein
MKRIILYAYLQAKIATINGVGLAEDEDRRAI